MKLPGLLQCRVHIGRVVVLRINAGMALVASLLILIIPLMAGVLSAVRNIKKRGVSFE